MLLRSSGGDNEKVEIIIFSEYRKLSLQMKEKGKTRGNLNRDTNPSEQKTFFQVASISILSDTF